MRRTRSSTTLATGYETSPDGLVWTFKIRTDIKFTDGTALTAEDVAFTYNQAKEAAKVSLPGFDTAVATGTDTVEIRLTTPSSTLLYTAATLGIVPRSTYSDGFGDNPVGSGPWRFGHYTQGQQLILERNDDYHGAKAKFAKATLLLMESDAALAAAQSGQVDLACVYPALSSQQIPGFSLTSLPTFDPRVISLPCVTPGAYEVEGQSVGNAVTSDPVIRKAMATALNREQIVKDCLLGYGEVAFDIFDAFPWGIKQEAASLKDGDVAGAEAMLDQAGWAKGEGGIRDDLRGQRHHVLPGEGRRFRPGRRLLRQRTDRQSRTEGRPGQQVGGGPAHRCAVRPVVVESPARRPGDLAGFREARVSGDRGRPGQLVHVVVHRAGLLGAGLGMVAGKNRGRFLDRVISTVCYVFAAIPTFWFGIVLLLIFAVWLRWSPIGLSAPIGKTFSETTLAERLNHLVLLIDRCGQSLSTLINPRTSQR